MNFSELEIGQTLENEDWLLVDQQMINLFAEATGDHQWIHLDEERCRSQSPFKTTIAHGFLTTSLMPKCFGQLISVDPATHTMLNYGLDSLRFLESVRSNDEIKYQFTLHSIDEKPMGLLHKVAASVSIKGREKPAMVGVFLMMLIKH